MYLETLVACSLTAALGSLSPDPRYDDALLAAAFAGLSAWTIAARISPLLYYGPMLMYVASFAADRRIFDQYVTPNRKQHLVRLGQSALPALAIVVIWIAQPRYRETGLVLAGAIWFKHAVLDQRRKRPLLQ